MTLNHTIALLVIPTPIDYFKHEKHEISENYEKLRFNIFRSFSFLFVYFVYFVLKNFLGRTKRLFSSLYLLRRRQRNGAAAVADGTVEMIYDAVDFDAPRFVSVGRVPRFGGSD